MTPIINTLVRNDLTRVTLGVLCIGGMLAATILILQPFLLAAIWAVTLVVSTWGILLRVQSVLWGRRGLAVLVMTLALLVIVLAPVAIAITTIASNSHVIIGWIKDLISAGFPMTPAWVAGLPVVGAPLAEAWDTIAQAETSELAARVSPYIGRGTEIFVSAAGSIGLLLVQMLLTVAISAILYASGEKAERLALRFGHRLAGRRGEVAIHLAGQAIHGVALGIVITAIVQAALAGIALVIAGVPFAAILTALILMLCILQAGPALVLVPLAIWFYFQGSTGLAIFIVIATVVIIAVESLLRPVLIKRGADLPMLVIFGGVIGGLLAFGLIGIFLGPALLAVSYTLLLAWMADDTEGEAPAP